MTEQFRIEPLSGDHDRSRFLSGSAPLDRYFRERASQDNKRRIAFCFVAVSVETKEVAGFYTLTAASVALDAPAPEIVRKLPRYPVVPAALLGRLAAEDYQGKGFDGSLLSNALRRTGRAAKPVQPLTIAMLVDAKDEVGQRFTSITDSRYWRPKIVACAVRLRWRCGRSRGERSGRF